MSLDLGARHASHKLRPAWSGSAFIVEALLLLVFLMASLAIFCQVFALAAEQSTESDRLSQAVATASTVAERFSANPSSVDSLSLVNGLVVTCEATTEPHDGGSLHKATISVFERDTSAVSSIAPKGDPLYVISTASYKSEVGS